MDFQSTFARHIGKLYHFLTKRLQELLDKEQAGITADQFRMLNYLWKEDGISQQQLAVYLGRDRAGITRMADILEDQGLITRIADSNDRRVNLLYLTKHGKAVEPIATRCAHQCLEELCVGFSKEEQETFERLLLKAINNFQQ